MFQSKFKTVACRIEDKNVIVASMLLFVKDFSVEISSDMSLNESSKRVVRLSVITLISCRALTCR